MNARFQAMTLAVLLIGAAGCKNLAKINVTVVDERTQLENQVLGSYEALSDDLALVASVRGIDEQGNVKKPSPASKEKKRALLAVQNREFNRDDIEAFKQKGLAGENGEGLLTFFDAADKESDAKYKAFAKAKIEEENQDRIVLMERIIETTPGLSRKDLPSVQKVMARKNRDSAKSGEKVQLETGDWVVKSEKTP
jgi:hypothetical protein